MYKDVPPKCLCMCVLAALLVPGSKAPDCRRELHKTFKPGNRVQGLGEGLGQFRGGFRAA